MRNIIKTFPGVKAVDRVSIKIKRGTVHAIVGENGAGKSTLMKILAGEYIADSGEILFNGEKVEIKSTKDAIDMGISTVYQELNLVPEMTIAENIFLGRELKGKNKLLVDANLINEETKKYLRSVGLPYNPKTKLKELSIAAQQMIEITKGITRGSKLIVLDEPTSAITDSEIGTLFSLITDLKSKGITFIYISHKLDEIFSIADEVTVMRDGTLIDSRPVHDLTKNSLISLMVGRELTALFPKLKVKIGDEVLKVEGLCRTGKFSDISFNVRRGEILGVAGLMGAGRTEVMRAIFGLDPLNKGKMYLEGKLYNPKSPKDAINRGIAYVPEDRKRIGLCLGRPILENISLPNLEMFINAGLLDLRKELESAKNISEKLKIKTDSLNTAVGALSGGNQQKVVLSKWLLRNNLKLLILDEPTRGIDVGAKSEIHKLMCEFAEQGIAIIMISSELPEILGMSDRILVMHEGKLKGELFREEASQESIMNLATGGHNA
jgi:inositol transport system ATP-binding protein